MRYASIAVLLALFALSSEARSDEVPGPVRTEGRCRVPADTQNWTKQEIFVWERICAGEVANFNEAVEFGGYVNPKNPKGLPNSRILRPDFLAKILLDSAYRKAIPHQGVRIVGARFTDQIDLVSANLEHELWLVLCQFDRGADFTRVNSGKLINLRGSKVTGPLIFDEATIRESLYFSEQGEFENVSLDAAHIGRQLSFTRSTITGLTAMDSLRVDGTLSANIAKFGEVQLQNAHIGGNLMMINATLTDRLAMDSLRVDGSLILRGYADYKQIILRNAHIGGQISLIGANIAEEFICYGTTIGKDFFLKQVTFKKFINCRTVKVGQSLELDEATFGDEVDFTGAQIGGEISLGSGEQSAQWGDSAKLILTNARADTIPSLSDAWPTHIEVSGLVYRNLRDTNSTGLNEKTPLVAGLFEKWFEKQAHYSPQTYEQLGSVFKNQGQTETATAIRYAGNERARSEAIGINYGWLTLLKYTIGYGHYTERAIFWVVGFIVVGVLVLNVSGEGKRNRLPYGVFYSFDMLLPVIKLREAHYKIDLDGWPRYYFYLHKIAGFVLASFLIAGISGLTK